MKKTPALLKGPRAFQVFRPSAGSDLYCETEEYRTKLGFWFFERHDVVFDKKIMRQITYLKEFFRI